LSNDCTEIDSVGVGHDFSKQSAVDINSLIV